jgi:hypothetical protein
MWNSRSESLGVAGECKVHSPPVLGVCMPPHIESGTPKRKNRQCPLCEARPRKTKGMALHMKDVHGIDDMEAWSTECFNAWCAGFR